MRASFLVTKKADPYEEIGFLILSTPLKVLP